MVPFILASIFAYIFNPLVSFVTNRIKLPRALVIIIIYAAILISLTFLGINIARRAIEESQGLRESVEGWIGVARGEAYKLPDFVGPSVREALASMQSTLLASSVSFFAIFPQAISGIASFFIFLVSGFYLLKEGRSVFDKLLFYMPKDYRIDAEILLRKINTVLHAYLRGQLITILISFTFFFIFLSVLGVEFTLILALISGFSEIIPIIGPIISTAIIIGVILLTGVSNFDLGHVQAVIIITIGSFAIRQLQDLFITPNIMGRIVKLHPFIVLFAVISGGHLGGILGLILAVPIAATIKILLEFSLDKINERKQA